MIICFSGTGNSLRVARQLSSLLGDSITELRGSVLLSPEQFRTDGSERIIWVFPTHSWGVPPMLLRFMRKTKIVCCDHYMVTTCGDDIGNCHIMWRKAVTETGGNPVAAFSVTMPNTYVAFPGFDTDSAELEYDKLEKSADRVRAVAECIRSGKAVDDVTRGAMPWLKTSVIYPWFVRNMINPRKFHLSDSCVGCGTCAGSCPVDNITLKDGRPVWGNTCAMCLACYHSCPGRAIDYGKLTRGKHQYKPEK